MIYSEIGIIAEKYWLAIPNQFQFAKLDVHVVMPNHVHGIIIIDKPNGGCGIGTNEKTKCDKYDDINDGVNGALDDVPNDVPNVETRLIASLQSPQQRIQQRTPQPPSQSVPPFPPKPDQQPGSQPKTGGFAGNKNPMIHENVSRIIRWYKGRCSFEIGKIHANFGWQSLYYDHIIRDDASLQRIRNYIINNPNNWKEDRFFM